MFCNLRIQKGFSLPVAIFILVIMALIATAVVSIYSKSLSGVSQEVLSTRAFYAAESGAQHVLGQLFPLAGGVANCSASSSLNFNTNGLNSCQVNMACSSVSINSEIFYDIVSTGTCSTGSVVSVRQIQLRAKNP
jgi:MSHA biogenesis protein MshP